MPSYKYSSSSRQKHIFKKLVKYKRNQETLSVVCGPLEMISNGANKYMNQIPRSPKISELRKKSRTHVYFAL